MSTASDSNITAIQTYIKSLETSLATANASLATAQSALSAATAADTTDKASLVTALANLATANASVTTLTAQLAAANATILKLQGTPTPVPTPPPVVPTFTAVATSASTIAVSWTNVTPTILGRDGVDQGGSGVWDTNTGGFGGVPTIAVNNKTFTFTYLNPSSIYNLTLTYSGGVLKASATTQAAVIVTPPAPTPAPLPLGRVFIGAFTGYGTGGNAAWDSLVGRASTMPMTYMDTHDTGGVQGVIDWVKANPTKSYKLSLNVLIGEAGNFTSQAERDRCKAIAQMIQNAGVGDRIVIRHMYEFNANYGFEWQPLSHGNNFAAAIQLYRDIVTVMRSVCPALKFVWCCVPWDNYDNNMTDVWPGADVVDIVGLDVYDSDPEGPPLWQTVVARAKNGIAYARAKGKPWSFDEWAGRATQDQGVGDDPVYITNMMELCITPNPTTNTIDCHSNTFYDSGAGGVDETLDGEPQSLTAYKAELTKF